MYFFLVGGGVQRDANMKHGLPMPYKQKDATFMYCALIHHTKMTSC